MRIAVVGAGAIGSAAAAILAAAGRDVVLVARGQRLRALRAAPQIIYGGGKAIEVPLVSQQRMTACRRSTSRFAA